MGQYSESTGTLRGQNDIAIFWRTWAADNPRAVVILVHGLGEHCGRYDNIIYRLAGEGISFYALDHRGTGKSQGVGGHLEKFRY